MNNVATHYWAEGNHLRLRNLALKFCTSMLEAHAKIKRLYDRYIVQNKKSCTEDSYNFGYVIISTCRHQRVKMELVLNDAK